MITYKIDRTNLAADSLSRDPAYMRSHQPGVFLLILEPTSKCYKYCMQNSKKAAKFASFPLQFQSLSNIIATYSRLRYSGAASGCDRIGTQNRKCPAPFADTQRPDAHEALTEDTQISSLCGHKLNTPSRVARPERLAPRREYPELCTSR